MHDIWNPWHGCVKKSEGCQNCYMYFLDKQRGMDGSRVFKVSNKFNYPLQKDKSGKFKIQSGEKLRVCLTSDFFLEEADKWRGDVWKIIKARPDVLFSLITKRPERIEKCLPNDWGNNGWDNVSLSVTTENQLRADERIPILATLPFKHKEVMIAPFIGPVNLKQYLGLGFIEQVIAGGENYDGSRPCHYEWAKNVYDECVDAKVNFCFMETGTVFVKNGKTYRIPSKTKQSEVALKLGLQYKAKELKYELKPLVEAGLFGDETEWYVKHYRERCNRCASKMFCNGCSDCGLCEGVKK